jgi:beta-carotene 3-hydroxylase
MNGPILAVVVGVAMEPVSAAVHRFFGHGPGWTLHRDHHAPRTWWQRNDAIPLVFAVLAMLAFAIAVARDGFDWLFWSAVGVTGFGMTYALVHDVYIHRRVRLLPAQVRLLEPWRRAHLEHHRTGGAPYGVLLPLARQARPAHRTPDDPEAIGHEQTGHEQVRQEQVGQERVGHDTRQ